MTATQEDIEIGKNISTEILNQAGRMTMMSLGARDFVSYPYCTDDKMGGVRFTVGNGRWVCEIVLEYSDTYTVRFITKRAGNVRYEMSDVYFDMLREILLTGFHEALYGKN